MAASRTDAGSVESGSARNSVDDNEKKDIENDAMDHMASVAVGQTDGLCILSTTLLG